MKASPVFARFCYSAIFILFTSTVFAQYYDSVNFTSTNWNIEKLSRGAKLYTKHFNTKNLFHSNQYISYVIVKRRVKDFDIAAEPKVLRTVSDFANANNALAAVNGNFFDINNGGAVDFTKDEGRVINENKTPENRKLAFHQKAAIVIEKGKPAIVKWDGFANWEENLQQETIMLNGPLLMLNNVPERLDSSSSFTITRHPRTCVGITKRGKVIMLVADGRNANAQGLNLFELAKIMRWLGCVSAINFDGGGSTTLWVDEKGVVNHPTDNAKWDNGGERKVANVFYVRRRK